MDLDYDLAVQAAIVAALHGAPDVVGIVGGRIYGERPPTAAAAPYVYLEDIVVRPIRSDCGKGATVTFGVVAVSDSASVAGVEGKRAANAVVASLDSAPLDLGAFHLVQLHWITTTGRIASDGKTYERISAYRATIDA